jgi:mono/diheme cytochrome c family protein
MKTLLAIALLLLAASGCGAEERPQGQWPISKSELEKSAAPTLPGEATYRRYCVACHGADGRGNGGITGADFVGQAAVIGLKPDSELSQSVREGKRGSRAIMPSHKPVLSDAQIGEVVAYVRKRFMPAVQPASSSPEGGIPSVPSAP